MVLYLKDICCAVNLQKAWKQAVVVHSEMDQIIKGLNTDILKLITRLKKTTTKSNPKQRPPTQTKPNPQTKKKLPNFLNNSHFL